MACTSQWAYNADLALLGLLGAAFNGLLIAQRIQLLHQSHCLPLLRFQNHRSLLLQRRPLPCRLHLRLGLERQLRLRFRRQEA